MVAGGKGSLGLGAFPDLGREWALCFGGVGGVEWRGSREGRLSRKVFAHV